MKKSVVVYFTIHLVLGISVFAQNTTGFHYLLTNGNKWEYEEKSGGLILTETRKVIGDTLLPNGKTYKVVEQIHQRDGKHLIFQRLVKNEVYQFAPRFVPPDSLAHEEILLFKLEVKVGDTWPYPPNRYQGFLADSGFYRVREIGFMNFANRKWSNMVISSYTLPDTGSWFANDIVLLDSLGVYYDAFEGGYYRLRGAIINGRQFGTITHVNESPTISTIVPTVIPLFTTYPNPVVSDTKILFDLRRPSEIQISIFDLLGRQVYEFPAQNFQIGTHVFPWNGTDRLTGKPVPNGIYFIFLSGNSTTHLTRKFMLLR
jgi:hypothetical protein